jgi:acyl-CoA synthetase (AMP-forming)/AMP-acid ligase II
MWTSPYEPLPAAPPLVSDLVAEAGERDGAGPALIDAATGARFNRRTLAGRVARVAASLRARGFGPGDVLAIWAPNSPDWAVAALGAMTAGGAVTGLGVVATDAEVGMLVRRTRTSILAADTGLVSRARAVARATGVPGVAVLGEVADPPDPGRSTCRGPAPEDVALLPSSSGTTGPPKSVVLTHGNLAAGVGQLRAGIRYTGDDDDVVLALAPFPHVLGFVVTLAAPLAAGATVVTVPRFDLGAVVNAVEAYRVTVLAVPPPVLAALSGAPQALAAALSSGEFLAAGGAPVTPALQERAAARFPRAVIAQGYGMTETTAVIPVPDRHRGTPPGSVGLLGPGTQARLVDVEGRDLGSGADGELWVRGPQTTPGYLGDPAADADLFGPDGWLRTGDLARMDGDGSLRIVDRLKELIKVDGLQVAPAELEALLLAHPAVSDAAVVGLPDDQHGEVPVAAVVPRGHLDAAALISWAAEQVSPHKRLRAVHVVGQIPRTPAGKVLRRSLRPDAARPAPAPSSAGVTTG